MHSQTEIVEGLAQRLQDQERALSRLGCRLRIQQRLTVGLVVTLATIGVTTAAHATIPSGSDHVFHGCYNKTTGALRLIDVEKTPAQKCSRYEIAVSWRQSGDKGDPGGRGPGEFVTLASADLSNADLRYRNLTGQDLQKANATDANFTGVDFSGADLKGATMARAILTGVVWSNTTCPDGSNSNDNGNTCVGHLTVNSTTTVTVAPNGSLSFSSANVTIHPGDSVHWTWGGGPHTVTSGTVTNGNPSADHQFCSPTDDLTKCGTSGEPASSSAATYDHKFTVAGTYHYFCRIHPDFMQGTVTVQS